MKPHTIATLLLVCTGALLARTPSAHGRRGVEFHQSDADPEITAYIGKIRAVDSSHANSVGASDSDQDALPSK
jgi:hypothetical protein